MNRIQVLDCTLRDGGYCNDCKFGFANIKKIVRRLVEANIDIVECGFLTNTVAYNIEKTRFNTLEQVKSVLPQNRGGKTFVLLANYGDYQPQDIPVYDGASIDGLRIAFHKKDMVPALEQCKLLQSKGYKVFIQAMVSISYSDEEFLDLIGRVNEIEPYAFYIVDSFGMMKRKDLTRMFYLVEHNLKDSIQIGFHSHNNIQLAYSNAQWLVEMQTNCDLIIDSSVYGMGRGAGNLNTELFLQYLNENAGGNYILKPLLSIIDEILIEFYQRCGWGYSLPNYLSAMHNVHPNYSAYLDDKKTLTFESMDEIFDEMDEDKKVYFDKQYIEELYISYMTKEKKQKKREAEMIPDFRGKKVLLIAPGKSSVEERKLIQSFAQQEDVVSISINFDYQTLDTDYIFLSNLRRFRELNAGKRQKCIITSNITADDALFQVDYKGLLNDEDAVRDNAGLMAIQFLIQLGVAKVFLAGFDGYAHDANANYGDDQMTVTMRSSVLDAMNVGMTKVLRQYAKQINIVFLTTPKHLAI